MIAMQRQQLDWFRLNSRERTYQLRSGSKKVVSLSWDNGRCPSATAEAHGERWLFNCIGYLSKQVVVQSPRTGKMIAKFVPNTGGGTLHMTDGTVYTLKSEYPLHPEMRWENEDGETLVRFHGDFGFENKSGDVELARHLPPDSSYDITLLTSLGWYLMVSSFLDMTLIM